MERAKSLPQGGTERNGISSGEVRVERCGKSAPGGWEQSAAVNSIRSNTGMGASGFVPERLARPLPGWLERAGNSAPR